MKIANNGNSISFSHSAWLKFLDNTIVYALFFLLLADSFTGIIVNEGISFVRPSNVLKVLLMLSMAIRLVIIDKSFLFIALFYLSWIFALLAVFYYTNSSLSMIGREVNFLLKVFLPLLSYYYFRHLFITRGQWMMLKTNKIIWFNFWILAINLILGILGFGYAEYTIGDRSIGSSGYFTAGNEVAAVMIILQAFVLFQCWSKKQKYYLPLAAICFFIAVCKATKVAMLGSLLCILLIPLISEHTRLFKLTKLKFRMVAIILIALFLIVNAGVLLIEEIGLMDRWADAFRKTDLLTTIMSGRNLYLRDAWYLYTNDYSLLEQVFGRGLDPFVKSMIPFYAKEKNVEMDFFDIFFCYGGLGLILVFVPYLKMGFQSLLMFKSYKSIYSPAVLVSNILLLLVSFIAGHVIGGGMVAVFLGLINALAFYEEA